MTLDKKTIAVVVAVAGAVWGAAEYLNRFALASDQAAIEQRVRAHDVTLGRFDEDLHWIMDRMDGLDPPRPVHDDKPKR